MAYRTFHNEPYFKAPDINERLPRTINILQQAVNQIQRRQQQNRALAANYEADKLASNFTTDQADLNDLTAGLAQEGARDFRQLGQLSPATLEKANRHQGYKMLSDAQWKMKEDLEKSATEMQWGGPTPGKNYFMRDKALSTIKEAAYGNEQEKVNFFNRGDRLKQAANQIGNDPINELNKDAFVADYIAEMKNAELQRESKNPTGIKTGYDVKATFFDENGNPGVTQKHAADFIASNPHIQKRYEQELDLELLDDARKMMATKEGEWLKGMPPAEIIKAFREQPELNTQSKLNPGDRMREMARRDLDAKHQISIKNSYDAGSAEEGYKRGLTSKDWGLENSYNPNKLGGPGGVFINKKTQTKGIPIKIGVAFDKNSMKLTGNNRSPRTLFADGFNLLPVWADGKPLELPGNSVDEQIQFLNSIPDEKFKELSLETVIHGKSYNTTDLDQSRKEYETLRLTPEDMMDDAERKRFRELGATLEELRVNPDLAPDIIQAKLGVAVEDVIKVIKPGTNEAKEIKGKLGNFDITDPRKLDDEQKRLVAAFNAKKAKAQGTQYGKAEVTKRKQEAYQEGVKKITGKETKPTAKAVQIPTGRVKVKGPDGKTYHLPKEQIDAAKEAGYTVIE